MAITPTPVRSALFADGELVGGKRLRELTLGLSVALEEIGSPLVAQQPYSELAWVRTAYVLTLPAAEARAQWKAGSLDAAALAWADSLPAGVLPELIRACGRIADRALGMLAPGSDAGKGGDVASDAGSPEGNAFGARGTGGSHPSGGGPRCTSAPRSSTSQTESPSVKSSSPAASGAPRAATTPPAC